jgi:predicted RNase H-like HicB family nuclease
MENTYTAVIKEVPNYWIGWIKEIPGVNCQERTKEELLESLRVTLREAIEFNREDAVSLIGKTYYEELISI